jgi:hypothetical protein
MSEGLQRVIALTIGSQLNEGDYKFLRALASWQHVASPRDLGPQTSQDENRARQKCKRKGLVTFEGGYWRTTDLGRQVLRL